MAQQPRTETDPQMPGFVDDGGAAQEAMPADDIEDGEEDKDDGEEDEGEDAVPEA